MTENKQPPAPTQEQKPLEIQVPPEIEKGVYSNFAFLSHGTDEFIFDFIFFPPQKNPGKVLSRVILSPAHAKRFLHALNDNLKKYEARFGEIKITGREERKIGFC